MFIPIVRIVTSLLVDDRLQVRKQRNDTIIPFLTQLREPPNPARTSGASPVRS